MTLETKPVAPELQELDRVTIRFAGDSGDGMQLTGTQFTRTAAVYGNDISTLPDFPAEIRAPAGSLPGVSGFQISFSSSDIHTPGDQPDVLVAMNPAALKTNVGDLPAGGALIVNSDAFTQQNLNKAGYAANPLTDGTLKQYALFEIPISTLNERSLDGLDMTSKQKDLTKNFFALGIMFWLYGRDSEGTIRWIEEKFGKRPVVAEANTRALKAGYAFGETTEIFHTHYRVAPAKLAPGIYRNITGQRGDRSGHACGVEARRAAAVLRLVPDHAGVGHPPPAVGLQELRRQDVPGGGRDRRDRCCDRRELRRRDGDDGIVRARASPSSPRRSGSRSWSSCRWSSSTSSAPAPLPGCRRRPSRRTCSRSCSGATAIRRCRSSRRPRPGECFDIAIEAWRLALKYMTPVVYLSDAFLANGAEPWRIPSIADLPDISVENWTEQETFQPYERDPGHARPPVGDSRHARPGAPDRRSREGRHHRQRQLRPGQPPPDAAPPPGEGRPHRRRHPAARGLRAGPRRPADPRLGLDLRRDPERRRASPQRRAGASPTPTCAT